MTATLPPAVEARLQDLCGAIASDPEVHAAREKAEAFLADADAVGLYREMIRVGRDMDERDRNGPPIVGQELEAFEDLRDRADRHELIQGFGEAQGVLQNLANIVNAFVAKTIEQGRVPTEDEVLGGGCGEGCGCHS